MEIESTLSIRPVYRQLPCAEHGVEDCITPHRLTIRSIGVVNYDLGFLDVITKHDRDELLFDIASGARICPSRPDSDFPESPVGDSPQIVIDCFIAAVYEVDSPVGSKPRP
jgi:hypothetical protein